MLNHIVLMGRMVRDPELRYTQSQKAVVSFTIACDRDYEVNGERKCDFIDCVAWGHTAEFISKHFPKGYPIIVSGNLQVRDWMDKDGNKRRNAEVVADTIYFGENKKTAQSEEKNAQYSAMTDADGELPF